MSIHHPHRLAPNGLPYKSEETAASALKKLELDPARYKVAKYQGGWSIYDTAADAVSMTSEQPKAGDGPKVTYWWGQFQPKSNENEQNYVAIGVNGDVIQCKRGVEIILPSSYVEVADNATYNVYRQEPGEDRKVVGRVKRFPFLKSRQGTEKEFREFIRKGNAMRDAANAAKQSPASA